MRIDLRSTHKPTSFAIPRPKFSVVPRAASLVLGMTCLSAPCHSAPCHATYVAPIGSKPADQTATAATTLTAPTEREPNVRTTWAAMRPSDTPAPESDSERRLEAIGRLVHSRVDVRFEDVPIGAALQEIADAVGLNLLVFEQVDPNDARSGIDVDRRIDLTLEGVSGRAALEAVIGLASRQATWQVFNGVFEVGLRKDLARASARSLRTHDATDLSLDPPDFRGCGANHSRRSGEEIVAELVRMISTHCEPEAFRPLPNRSMHDTNVGSGPVQGGANGPNDQSTLNLDPSRGVVRIEGQWATIQTKEKLIVVSAPDFVHRAIEGCEGALPPRIGPPAAEKPASRATLDQKPAAEPRSNAPAGSGRAQP